ncbi:glycoside hydrolase family 31 protein [Treponema pectinovorum]|uniref:glycoside hydrolase family 31 protein n=1 Tax=Treponema pectinovorum TaxID=164 RepID=UPI0011C87CB5|nr:glycoside hydrolase family 31 protein [Treponema pectinovorum]
MILSHVNYKLDENKENVLTFKSKEVSTKIKVFVLEEDIIRVFFCEDTLVMDKTWTVAPGMEDIPREGRDRFDLSPFSKPKFKTAGDDKTFTVETKLIKMVITLDGFKVSWFYKHNGKDVLVLKDRQTQAYNFNHFMGKGVYHFTQRSLNEKVYGLGEKSGDMDRTGREFKMMSIDPMGYDAQTSDPLYKHYPFYICHNEETNLSYGLFYDNLATSLFDMGKTIDNYHGPFRSYYAEDGELDYYFIAGPHIKDITPRFSWLTGKTLFMPKWSLGYSGSTMTYTDAPDAQVKLMDFIKECEENKIPCDSFQLSSGYTSINGKRYVFNWNYDKFPDPKAFAKSFHDRGVRLCANIKPALLVDHPLYKEVDSNKLFIKDSNNNVSEMAQFWDDLGSYVDFTNPQAFDWWKKQVTMQLLEYGIDSTWNDNNEFEIWDGDAKAAGFGKPVSVGLIRPVLTLLMMKASFEAQNEFESKKRPYLISRSGCPGMQRYVQTWSGDNRTDWKTIRFNNKMGSSLSLCGMYNIGHDIGGFAGLAPEPELFVRWVQNGSFTPRFTIHSWNDDKTVNVPWMYPEYTDLVKKAMLLRCKFIPHFYNLLYKAHAEYEPFVRPVFYNYENDKNTYAESDDFMVGNDLLVASVVNKGQYEREVYLPVEENGWVDYHTGLWYEGGQTVKISAPIEYNPLLVRGGAIIAVNDAEIDFTTKGTDKRGFLLYPALKGSGKTEYQLFEDDGITKDYESNCAFVNVKMKWSENSVDIEVSKQGKFALPYKTVALHLQNADKRTVTVNGKKVTSKDLQNIEL